MNEEMADIGPELSTEEMADLSALADGTLPAARRAAVEARVAESPELQELVERQRQAVAATSILADEPVPDSLQAGVGERARRRSSSASPGARRSWRLAPGLALGGAVAAVAAILAITLIGGPAGPSVADAARFANLPPSGPAPASAGGSRTKLAIGVEGVAFPDFLRSHGWRASGVRHGKVGDRDATAVFYAKGSRRIVYVIVSGSGLPQPSDATLRTLGGVEYRSLNIEGRAAVTWRRAGHTCLLIGQASSGELLSLAAWQGNGTLRY
jgi:anti-sigma factor RsiW